MKHAMIILGAGQLPNGTISSAGKVRIQAAYEKYLTFQTPPVIILSGGKKDSIQSEASLMEEYIHQQCPNMSSCLLREEFSQNTLENAFFSKLIHIDFLGIRKIWVVSSDFHIPRVQQIFTHLFDRRYQLDFLPAKDPAEGKEKRQQHQLKEERLLAYNQEFLFTEDVEQNLHTIYRFIFRLNSDFN